MDRSEILRCLGLLDSRLARPVDVTVGGGAALILAHGFDRQTADIDILITAPPLDPSFRQAVLAVAAEEELPQAWINDAAKGFVDVLDPSFLTRRVEVLRANRLKVFALARPDLILMKLFAMRATDIDDLRSLNPSDAELDFVRGELDRISSFSPKAALAISLYLDQGGDPDA